MAEGEQSLIEWKEIALGLFVAADIVLLFMLGRFLYALTMFLVDFIPKLR